MNALHLLWICPACAALGVLLAALLAAGRKGEDMSQYATIEKLCALLDAAQIIIREQAALLAMHGIETDDGELERRRGELLAAIPDREEDRP